MQSNKSLMSQSSKSTTSQANNLISAAVVSNFNQAHNLYMPSDRISSARQKGKVMGLGGAVITQENFFNKGKPKMTNLMMYNGEKQIKNFQQQKPNGNRQTPLSHRELSDKKLKTVTDNNAKLVYQQLLKNLQNPDKQFIPQPPNTIT